MASGGAGVTPFWVVWSPRGGQVRVRHASAERAHEEAVRLANKFHGRHFYVLEMTSFAIVGPETLTKSQQKRQADEILRQAVNDLKAI